VALPVLLVHGFASSFERNWRELGWVDLLADAGREVIGVDLLGHGTADKPHDPADYADLASHVEQALPDHGSPVDAIGFSLGARLLLEVASRRPDRFEHVVVGGVGQNLFGRHDPEPLAAAVESGDAPPGGIAHLFVQYAEGSGNDRKALAACLRRPEQPLTAEQLGRVTCPSLVVIGDQDFAGPADPLVEALPDARLVVLRNTEHFGTPKSFGFIDASLEFLGAVPV
jgi:pimeloyl-ACP methyl ester carboxylesterase